MMSGKLSVTTPSDREIVVARELNAPRALVFECLTTPKLLQRWMLGPPGWTLPVCEFDAKAGGTFRYVWRSPEGQDMGMGGTIEIFEPHARIVHTEIFDQDWTGGRTQVTTLFTEVDGKTILTMTILYASQEARDGALKSGMTEGMEMGYGKLDALLAELG
jgi:uncharacterized protein YndB with AHSA1/START domain